MVQGLGARHKGRSALDHLHESCMPEKDGAERGLGRNGIVIITSRTVPGRLLGKQHSIQLELADLPRTQGRATLSLWLYLCCLFTRCHFWQGSSNFYIARTCVKGTQQAGVPPHHHRMAQPAKQQSIWTGRETHKDLQGR